MVLGDEENTSNLKTYNLTTSQPHNLTTSNLNLIPKYKAWAELIDDDGLVAAHLLGEDAP